MTKLDLALAVALMLAAGGAAPCLAQTGTSAVSGQLDPERLALASQIIDLSYPPELGTRCSRRLRTR